MMQQILPIGKGPGPDGPGGIYAALCPRLVEVRIITQP
jgi:hypothetical protein